MDLDLFEMILDTIKYSKNTGKFHFIACYYNFVWQKGISNSITLSKANF